MMLTEIKLCFKFRFLPSNYCVINKTLPLASFKIITDFERIVNMPEMTWDWRFCFINDLFYRVNTQEEGLFFSPVLIGTESPMALEKFAVEQWQLKNQVQTDSSSSAGTVLTANWVDIIWRLVPVDTGEANKPSTWVSELLVISKLILLDIFYSINYSQQRARRPFPLAVTPTPLP